MSVLLHIFAHPLGASSHTLHIAHAFLESYQAAHPHDHIDTLDLYQVGVPHLSAAHLAAMAAQGEAGALDAEAAQAWEEIMAKVSQFTAADKYLISCPMWNFGVPSIMKAYVDHIVMANYTFRYSGPGASIGMMSERPMALIGTHGGAYSQPPMDEFEMCTRYLRTVFGFLGFTIVAEIIAEGLAMVGPHEMDAFLQPVFARAREVAATF